PMKASFEIPFGWYPQIVYFAGMARRHMALYGTTEAQLGEIAVAFRRHAALSENALLGDKPLTLEQYLAEPYLAEPFRASDCCLVNDGAGAFVMTALERARDLRQPPVDVLGVGAGVSEEGENPSGGQLAQAFMLSMNNLCESVRQLRGAAGPRQVKDAEVGLVAGYSGCEHATLLLGRG